MLIQALPTRRIALRGVGNSLVIATFYAMVSGCSGSGSNQETVTGGNSAGGGGNKSTSHSLPTPNGGNGTSAQGGTSARSTHSGATGAAVGGSATTQGGSSTDPGKIASSGASTGGVEIASGGSRTSGGAAASTGGSSKGGSVGAAGGLNTGGAGVGGRATPKAGSSNGANAGRTNQNTSIGVAGTRPTGTAGAGTVVPSGDCSDAVQSLRDFLKLERSKRPLLAEQCFAQLPITKAEAETARGLLVEDHAAEIRETRATETSAKSIALGGKTMRYAYTVFGQKPATGRSLFLSLHGGGEAEASVNDEQWENQKQLYQPDEGVYLCPRAPTNTWNLWHEAHIDPMFQRLIEDMIVFQEVNPNRVYVMGYSAGGDGVYQLGPRMADYWAAASMMAGHPNDAKPDSLRNIGFTIHVGALDTSYDRNLKAQEWGKLLDGLAAADPGAYPHLVQVHANKSHWMDLEDAVAVPWMADFTRNPIPTRVVWLQDDVPHERFYWLRVKPDQAIKATRVVAQYSGQDIKLEATGLSKLSVRLSDAMMDLDLPVTISAGAKALFSGSVSRTIGTLAVTLQERGDPALMFAAEIEVSLPK